MLDNEIFAFLSFFTAVAFTAVAALVPPNAGNLVAGIFLATMASFLGGEEENDSYEREIEDEDI